MKKLPIYKGWTVDYKLKQFRKIPLNKLPQFVDFDSDLGDKLFCQMLKKGLIPNEILCQFN